MRWQKNGPAVAKRNAENNPSRQFNIRMNKCVGNQGGKTDLSEDEMLLVTDSPLSVRSTDCLSLPLSMELRLDPGDDPQPPGSPGLDLGVWSES